MHKYGLKLWSNNENYIEEAKRLLRKKVFDYIELFAVPDSYERYIDLWKTFEVPFVIHAPHTMSGLNLAQAGSFEKNMRLAGEAIQFADNLGSEIIIFHSGVKGEMDEAVIQLKKIYDPRIVIENKPYYTLMNDGTICNGNSPEEIRFIMEKTGMGFCFDVGHAVYSANARKKNIISELNAYKELNPRIYHLMDGEWLGTRDKHLNLGKGDFKLDLIADLIADNSLVTVETNKGKDDSMIEFIEDVKYLKSLEMKLTQAGEKDLMEVFSLSNDPLVRKMSFNQQTISLDEHIQWYMKKINDPECAFYIIRERSNTFAGYVRFDKTNDSQNDYVITIHLSPQHRGKGLGELVIKKASMLLFKEKQVDRIISRVKIENIASLQSFKNVGYSMNREIEESGCKCFGLELRFN